MFTFVDEAHAVRAKNHFLANERFFTIAGVKSAIDATAAKIETPAHERVLLGHDKPLHDGGWSAQPTQALQRWITKIDSARPGVAAIMAPVRKSCVEELAKRGIQV